MMRDADEVPQDLLGYRADLLAALNDPRCQQLVAPPPSPAAETAYAAALALGRCRLFGVPPGDDLDGVLPADWAIAAAQRASLVCRQSTESAKTLPRRWDRLSDPAEQDNECARSLSLRMDLWAVEIALEESYADCLAEAAAGPVVDALRQGIDELQGVRDDVDDVLQTPEQMQILSTLVGTKALANWRALLAKPHRRVLPWWLDGRLEDLAHQVEEELVSERNPATILAATRQVIEYFLPGSVAVLGTATAAKHTLPPGQAVIWRSPDGKYRAELEVPGKITDDEYAKVHTINFIRCADDQQAPRFEGPIGQGWSDKRPQCRRKRPDQDLPCPACRRISSRNPGWLGNLASRSEGVANCP